MSLQIKWLYVPHTQLLFVLCLSVPRNWLFVLLEAVHTVIVCAYRVVVCVAGVGPGEHGALKVIFNSLLRSNNPHSGCVYPQSGCLCCRGQTLVNMGL